MSKPKTPTDVISLIRELQDIHGKHGNLPIYGVYDGYEDVGVMVEVNKPTTYTRANGERVSLPARVCIESG